MDTFIDNKCFSQDWITYCRNTYSGSRSLDPLLIEKCIHAFALLGYLVQVGLSFVFKGGTSLMLHVDRIQRLSIDIDIMTSAREAAIRSQLDEISTRAPFIRIEEDVRHHSRLPNRKHFKFFYYSVISSREESVLLDIVLENPDYLPDLIWKSIQIPFILPLKELMVRVPSIENLLGDKMTAFAPHTTGVPFGPNSNMQVVKQLFDIGILFDRAQNFQVIQNSFITICEKELRYRNNLNDVAAVLQDLITISIVICEQGLSGTSQSDESQFITDGIRKMSSHLISQFRARQEAKIAAAKVFCLANRIQKNLTFDFLNERYVEDTFDMSTIESLPEQYQRLNKLKITVPEAYSYLAKGFVG